MFRRWQSPYHTEHVHLDHNNENVSNPLCLRITIQKKKLYTLFVMYIEVMNVTITIERTLRCHRTVLETA